VLGMLQSKKSSEQPVQNYAITAFRQLIRRKTNGKAPYNPDSTNETQKPIGYREYLKSLLLMPRRQNNFLKMEALMRIELEHLMQKTGLPRAIIPDLKIENPGTILFHQLSNYHLKASYHPEENRIRINPKNKLNITVVNEWLNHEFKHFLDSIEIKKLEIQDPELFVKTIEEFAREYQQGKVLALGNWNLDPNSLKKQLFDLYPEILELTNSYQEKPQLRMIDKEIIRYLQKSTQDQLEQKNMPEFIDIDSFKNEYLDEIYSNVQGKLNQEAVSKELIAERIKNIIDKYNNANNRDKYAYLAKLNESRLKKAQKLLHGFLEFQANDYNINTYQISQDEASARILEYSYGIRNLLSTNDKLRKKIQNRPDKTKPLEMQEPQWLEELGRIRNGKELLKYSTNLRANSLLLQISKSLKQQISEEDLELLKFTNPEYIKKISKQHAKLLYRLSSLEEQLVLDFEPELVKKQALMPNPNPISIKVNPYQVISISHNLPLYQIIVLIGLEKLKEEGKQAWIIEDSINKNNYKKALKQLELFFLKEEISKLNEEAINIKLSQGHTGINYHSKSA
jgi:hypothetical protein